MSKLLELLNQRKETLRKRWYDLLLASYPEQTRKAWERDDQFGNPVGHEFKEGLRDTLNLLLSSAQTPQAAEIEEALLGTVRIRAVQNFAPSDAVSFLFLLKKAVREEVWSEVAKLGIYAELLAFESRVDVMALICLDMYCKCKEDLYRIKIDEIRRLQAGLLRKAGLVCDYSEISPAD